MTYEKPELLVISEAHTSILEQHVCTGGGFKGWQMTDFGGCQPNLTDGAYSIDE